MSDEPREVGDERWERLTVFAAAGLFLAGVLTGPLVAAAHTGALGADPGSMLAAHLNAILGCFWILAVVWTLPRVRLEAKPRRALLGATVLAAVANWGLTLLKSAWKVQGLAYTGEGKNDTILTLLLLLVVLPTFASALLWVVGLWPRGAPSPATRG